VISINHFKTTTKHFLALYPASGFALCGIIFSLISLKFALVLSPLLCFKNFRKYILIGYLFALRTFFLPEDIPNQDMTLKGQFYPQKTKSIPTYFHGYSGIMGIFKTDSKKYQITIFDKEKVDTVKKPCFLFIDLQKGETFPKTLIKKTEDLNHRFNLFSIREKISSCLFKHFFSEKHEESSKLIYALLTGSLDHKLLKVKFSSFGLAHILALSGFHLSLLSGFCYFMLKFFISDEKAKFFSVVMLLFYFVYIGPACSITRAFSSSMLAYIHLFFSYKTKPLHTFSLSLLATTFICQKELITPGFALTFLATLALISFNKFWKRLLLVIPMVSSLWEKFIYAWLKLFCLQLFIFIFTLPACLYHFKQAFGISVFYNLFFPALVSLFMVSSCLFGLIKTLNLTLGNWLLEKSYLYFDLNLKLLESPNLAKGFIITWDLPVFLFITSLLCQITFVFHLFKKNKVI
jgi:ComEC/Rec2-related protein